MQVNKAMAKDTKDQNEKVVDKGTEKSAEIARSIKEKQAAVRDNKTIRKDGKD